MSNTLKIPSTFAGMHLLSRGGVVIKERLTSYGSIAIVKMDDFYVMVFFHHEELEYLVQDCGTNTMLIRTLWENIV